MKRIFEPYEDVLDLYRASHRVHSMARRAITELTPEHNALQAKATEETR